MNHYAVEKTGPQCPPEVMMAVKAMARAVELVEELAEASHPAPMTEYHATEYVDEMETLLLHQLLTAFPSDEERDAILAESGLDFLAERLHLMAAEWE